MLKVNRQPINKNMDNAVGNIANETRYAEDEKIRRRKRMNLPALTHGGICAFEQAWNKMSINKDVVKLTMKRKQQEIIMVFRRIDLEQMIFAMGQGDEVLKYVKDNIRSQRKYSELPDKRDL